MHCLQQALAAYLALWGLFSLVMFVITFRLSKALQVVFGLLVLLFLLLVVGNCSWQCSNRPDCRY